MNQQHHASRSLTLLRTLEDWALWQRAQRLSERTISERAGVVTKLSEHADAGALDLRPIDIIRYVGRAGLAASSAATYHASIRAYCAWLVRTGQRDDDPTKQTPTPKRPKARPRPVSSPQLGALLAVCNRRRTRAYVLLAALAGLRVHEVAKVHGRDVDLLGGVLTVTGKGGVTAMIPMHDDLWAEARSWPRDGYWFPAYAGDGPVTEYAVEGAIGGAMARAGIAATPHQLRHWYGTELVEQGVNLRIVQELMRHGSISSTQIYTNVTPMQMREGINTLRLPAAA